MRHTIHISLLTLLCITILQAVPKPAKFTKTGETLLQEKQIGPAGGKITETLPDKSILEIEFTPGSLVNPTKIALLEVTGSLEIHSGVPNSNTLRIDTNGVKGFPEAMNIQITPPAPFKKRSGPSRLRHRAGRELSIFDANEI